MNAQISQIPAASGPDAMAYVILAFLIIMITIGIFLLVFGYKELMEAKASSKWPSTQGVVLESKVLTRMSTTTRKTSTSPWTNENVHDYSYKADVTYEYKIDGNTYTGTRVAVGDLWRSDKSVPYEISARYPAGSNVAVFYNPSTPSACVLETGTQGQTFLASMVGLAFVVLGGVFLTLHIVLFLRS